MKEEAEMDRRWWRNPMIRRLGAAAMATMLALGVLPGPALALAVPLRRAVGLPEGEEAAIA